MLQKIINEVVQEIMKMEVEWAGKRDINKYIDSLFLDLLQSKIGSDYEVCVKADILDTDSHRAVVIKKEASELVIEYILRLSSRVGKKSTEYNAKDLVLNMRYNFTLEEKMKELANA